MFTICLTGGIATGKSTFAKLFRALAPTPETIFFDCDAFVHVLLTNPDVIATVTASLGQDLTSADGTLDRGRLRELVFGQPERRLILEGILHPLVREACLASQQQARSGGMAAFFLADVPLLYESGFPLPRDLDVVVACDPATQRSRLMARNRLNPELAERILTAQLPIAEKMDRADTVLWNGGPPEALRRQTESFFLWLKNKSSN